jgi:hypothetical protein
MAGLWVGFDSRGETWIVLAERFGRYGRVEFFGVLRFAQDDSKNKRGEGKSKGKDEIQGSFAPLRMTT